VWTGDITYIATQDGWLYLAVVIDLFSRQVVGWAMGERMTRHLVIDALTMAWFRRQPAKGLIFHSDQGSQYASADFQATLRRYGIRGSMSRKGNCWDNAVTETLFGSLKVERLHGMHFETRRQAKDEVVDWLTFYSRKRMHSTWRNRSGAAGAANALSPRKGSGFEGGGSPRCHGLVGPGARTATAFEENHHGPVCRVGRLAGSDDGACPG